MKKIVIDTIAKKQLSSVMNNTKWVNLQNAVLNSLPFPPPYQVKYVLEDKPTPEHFDQDVWYFGDWIEGIQPFYTVEWIRVRPRYQKNRGTLLSPELMDIRCEFISILEQVKVPYREEGDSVYIYGYISDTHLLKVSNESV